VQALVQVLVPEQAQGLAPQLEPPLAWVRELVLVLAPEARACRRE